jgi:hypothetical protein
MGFLADDSGGYVTPKDIIDVGEVLTPGEDYMYVGGGGPINMPYFPSTSVPFYVPPTPSVSQSPTSNEKGENTWVYVMIVAMMMIMVIVLAVVL